MGERENAAEAPSRAAARPRPARDPESDMYWFADLLNLGTAPSAVPDAPEAEAADPAEPGEPA